MTIESIVLTGGKSRRMGEDKAKLLVDGIPQAERIVSQLSAARIPVTVLGREPIEGASFLLDPQPSKGPLSALARFTARHDYVFIVSCDLPRFDSAIVKFLWGCLLEGAGPPRACAPNVDGFLQPYCALYNRNVFFDLRKALKARPDAFSSQHAGQCALTWLKALDPLIVSQEELEAVGLKAAMTRGANTPEELSRVLGDPN